MTAIDISAWPCVTSACTPTSTDEEEVTQANSVQKKKRWVRVTLDGGSTAARNSLPVNEEAVELIGRRLDFTDNMLGSLGRSMPKIVLVKLEKSNVPSLRDLGGALHTIVVLKLSRCGLRWLDGAGALQSVREIYIPFNYITDPSPLDCLTMLEVLDLEANDVDSLSSVQQLGCCSGLRYLTLVNNPVSGTPGYREAVGYLIPSLLNLDDRPLSHHDPAKNFLESLVFPSPSPLTVSPLLEDLGCSVPHPSAARELPKNADDLLCCHFARIPSAKGNTSTLTQHTCAVFCGKPTKGLKCIRTENETSPVKNPSF